MISKRIKTNEVSFNLPDFGPGGTLWTAAHGRGTQAQFGGFIELRQKSGLGFAEAAAIFQAKYREE